MKQTQILCFVVSTICCILLITLSCCESNLSTKDIVAIETTEEKSEAITLSSGRILKEEVETSDELEPEDPPVVDTTALQELLEPDPIPYSTPDSSGSFKSYTNYQMLDKQSSQWQLIQCNENAHSDENGLRKVCTYYCVAMGSYYTNTLGDLFRITTTGGTFEVIICDFKADIHTDPTNSYTLSNGCIIEFYIDMAVANSWMLQAGNVSVVDTKFEGPIVSIEKIGNYFE